MKKFDFEWIAAIVIILSIMLLPVLVYRDWQSTKACEKLGGVYVQGKCIKYEVIYPRRD